MTRSADALSPSAIGRDALVRQPHARRQLARLPEHVDRHAAARIPVAADAQVFRGQQRDELFADGDRAVLVKAADVAEAGEIELERFRLEEPFPRYIVDHQMREVGLTGDRAERGELGRGEARDVIGVGVRVGHTVELGLRRRGGEAAQSAEMLRRRRSTGHRYQAPNMGRMTNPLVAMGKGFDEPAVALVSLKLVIYVSYERKR